MHSARRVNWLRGRFLGVAPRDKAARFIIAPPRPPASEPTENESSGDKSSSDRRENEEEPSGAQPCRIISDHRRAGSVVEATTRPWIARRRRKKIVGTRVVPRFRGQLAVVAFRREVAVISTRKQHRADDRVYGRTAHP